MTWRSNRLLDRLLPARFGYLTETSALGVEAWLKHIQCGATLEFDECTHTTIKWYFVDCCCCQHLMHTPGTCVEKQHAACWCVYLSVSNVVFHIPKPCNSLACIQTLQRFFTYPNLTGSSKEDVPRVRQITDFKLCYTRSTHYDSVADAYVWISYSTNKCSWNRHNGSVKLLCCMIYIMRQFLLTSTHRTS